MSAGCANSPHKPGLLSFAPCLLGRVPALDAYLTGVARLSWLNVSPDTLATCTKATTRPGGKAWSISERCGALCNELALTQAANLLPLISLAVRWRNALVHSEDAEFKLPHESRIAQAKNPANFNKAAFSVTNAVERFDQGKDPTLKDVTTFVAYVQELCKSVDSAAIPARRRHGIRRRRSPPQQTQESVQKQERTLRVLGSHAKTRSGVRVAQSQKGFDRNLGRI